MKLHEAYKIVIITEKFITEKVAKLIEECGASGYTITSAGGKGDRGVRTDRSGPSDAFVNVKFEIITTSRDKADKIMTSVAEKYFTNFSGITYMKSVEILRPEKF